MHIIKENDLKSSKMPFVRSPSNCYFDKDERQYFRSLQYTKFPLATQLYYYFAEVIFDVIGLDISLVATSRWFDGVSFFLPDLNVHHAVPGTDQILTVGE